MIVELDCGNSFIKWRILGVDSIVLQGGVVESGEELFSALKVAGEGHELRYCRMVSVRSKEETDSLQSHLAHEVGLLVTRAKSEPYTAGVRNGYVDPARLGADRWMAVVAAYHLSGKACLVLDLGTAVTADFVSADGDHKGGFICPGLPLMRTQLCSHTKRIRYDVGCQDAGAMELFRPGRTTAEAVERGCVLMLEGFVRSQVELATSFWGGEYDVFLTGGDAHLVKAVRPETKIVPDLIFVGLGIACPIAF